MTAFDLQQTRNQAKLYQQASLSVLPIATGGTKAPFTSRLPGNSWLHFQTSRATDKEVATMFSGDRPMGVGIVCGSVSGCEVIDVDNAATWREYRRLVEKHSPGLLDRIPQVQTPREGGGRHLYVFSGRTRGVLQACKR